MSLISLKNLQSGIEKVVTSRFWSLAACLLCGILGSIPYYCEELFIFTFISLFAQFYIAINQKNTQRRVFLPFFCYFIGFFTPLYLFLSELYPYERFGFDEDQAIFIVICSCIFIPLLHAAVEALVMWVSKLFKGNNTVSALGYASLWVISEWVLTLGTLAFPWGNIAVSLTGFLPYLQTASLFGKYFISFITVFGLAQLANAVAERKKVFAFIGAAVIALNSLAGTVMWFLPSQTATTVSVAALQGNVLSNEKWVDGNRAKIFDKYIGMAEEAAKNGAEIIIMPESAIPFAFTENGIIHQALAQIATEYNVTVITGVSYYTDSDHYNSVIAILPDGSLSARYDKRHLVPFGEFMPFADILGKLFPFVGEFSSDSGSYNEGTESVVIETEYGTVAPLVCFDSIFSQFATEGVNNGADIIAVVTNDSWFNDSAGIYTHLRHAQLRAIENKRYILRAANTGVSAFIDEKGNIITQTGALTEDTIYSDVFTVKNKTLYAFTGDITLYASFIIVIVLFILWLIKEKSRNGKNTAS